MSVDRESRGMPNQGHQSKRTRSPFRITPDRSIRAQIPP
jgi:hypothetical protein